MANNQPLSAEHRVSSNIPQPASSSKPASLPHLWSNRTQSHTVQIPGQLGDSPFYPGKTRYGGISAAPSSRPCSSTPYQPPAKRKIIDKPARAQHLGVTSLTARRILQSLEKCSSLQPPSTPSSSSSASLEGQNLDLSHHSQSKRRRVDFSLPPVQNLYWAWDGKITTKRTKSQGTNTDLSFPIHPGDDNMAQVQNLGAVTTCTCTCPPPATTTVNTGPAPSATATHAEEPFTDNEPVVALTPSSASPVIERLSASPTSFPLSDATSNTPSPTSSPTSGGLLLSSDEKVPPKKQRTNTDLSSAIHPGDDNMAQVTNLPTVTLIDRLPTSPASLLRSDETSRAPSPTSREPLGDKAPKRPFQGITEDVPVSPKRQRTNADLHPRDDNMAQVSDLTTITLLNSTCTTTAITTVDTSTAPSAIATHAKEERDRPNPAKALDLEEGSLQGIEQNSPPLPSRNVGVTGQPPTGGRDSLQDADDDLAGGFSHTSKNDMATSEKKVPHPLSGWLKKDRKNSIRSGTQPSPKEKNTYVPAQNEGRRNWGQPEEYSTETAWREGRSWGREGHSRGRGGHSRGRGGHSRGRGGRSWGRGGRSWGRGERSWGRGGRSWGKGQRGRGK